MQNGINRRTFVRSAGAGLALASAGGIASAQESNDSSASGKRLVPIVIKDGQLELVLSDPRGNQITTQRIIRRAANAAELDPTATREVIRNGWITGWDAAAMLADGVRKLNSLEKEGWVTFEEADSTISVVPTEQLNQQYEESVSTAHNSAGTLSCGKTDYTVDMPGLWDPWVAHKLWTNDEDTEYLKTRLAQGGLTSGTLHAIFKGGELGGQLGATLAALLALSAGVLSAEMGLKNEGCGVVTIVRHMPIPPTTPVGNVTTRIEVKSQ